MKQKYTNQEKEEFFQMRALNKFKNICDDYFDNLQITGDEDSEFYISKDKLITEIAIKKSF